jgi:hypothetical protein
MPNRITKSQRPRLKPVLKQHSKLINPFKYSDKEFEDLWRVGTDKQAVPKFYPGHEGTAGFQWR